MHSEINPILKTPTSNTPVYQAARDHRRNTEFGTERAWIQIPILPPTAYEKLAS